MHCQGVNNFSVDGILSVHNNGFSQLRAGIILLVISIVFLSIWSICYAEDVHGTDSSTLLRKLRDGGYVIYLRHAATDHEQVDQPDFNFHDCSTQRNLSEEGRAQARKIAKAIREYKIPIARVLTSPFCRCKETAELAFNKAEVSQDLRFAIKTDKLDEQNLSLALRKMLATRQDKNTNTVIVSHTGNLKSAADIWPKPEGVAMIFKPKGNNRFLFVGKILPNQWTK